MTDLTELLKHLGLEHQEASVYIAALRLGTTPASTIAKRCKLPRSTARYTCEQLVDKQLMIETQRKNAKLFTAENPEKLKKLLEVQQAEIESKSRRLEGAMQDLKRIYNPYTVMPKMRFYEGVEGIIELANDFLKEGKTVFSVMTVTDEMHPEIKGYMEEKYIPSRMAIGNESWSIFNDNEQTKNYQKKDEKMNRKSLLVPYHQFPFDSCMHIYGDKVAFYSYNIGDMTGVMIENSTLRKAQMSLFRLAWNNARKLEQNKKYANLELPPTDEELN